MARALSAENRHSEFVPIADLCFAQLARAQTILNEVWEALLSEMAPLASHEQYLKDQVLTTPEDEAAVRAVLSHLRRPPSTSEFSGMMPAATGVSISTDMPDLWSGHMGSQYAEEE